MHTHRCEVEVWIWMCACVGVVWIWMSDLFICLFLHVLMIFVQIFLYRVWNCLHIRCKVICDDLCLSVFIGLCVCVLVCVVYCKDMWNEEARFAVAHAWTPPAPVFMGLVSKGLPFNLRYWLKIQCVVLPAHSKWTVYERISNLHKVLNQISGCPGINIVDIHWVRVRVSSKMCMCMSGQAAT